MSLSAPARCADCGAPLSPNEVKYYGHQCETCVAFDAELLDAATRDEDGRAWRRAQLVRAADHAMEAGAAVFGLLGAFLLAAKGEHAAWGWIAFLASNVLSIWFFWIRRHRWLLVQQLGFLATTAFGIWRWLL